MASELSEGLASAFLDGEWAEAALERRGRAALEQRPRWLAGLCRRVVEAFPRAPHEVAELAPFIDQDEPLRAALARSRDPVRVRRWFLPAPRMREPGRPAFVTDLPSLSTLGELAQALGFSSPELAWFADVTRRNASRAAPQLQHYVYRWVAKRSGGSRLLETPKTRLRRAQRWILRQLLAKVPVSDVAHGFVPGRSPLTFAAAHTGQRVVVRLDLEDFFTSIREARVRATFGALGYPHEVARALAGLCCTPTPHGVLGANPEHDPAERYRRRQRLRIPHLPQGAPTSPALSNLIAFRLDRRLSGLADAAGARYSRYADDLAFSGDDVFARQVGAFVARVTAIAADEGFKVRIQKTRIMPAGGRQRLAGLIVNARPSVSRRDYDALRATLHNAARFGAASQNLAQHPDFRAHLQGHAAWVEHTDAGRGARLRVLLDRIAWPAEARNDT